MASSAPLLLAYYGDDFTGSTDALESLACAGLRTRLFLNPPTAAQCAGLDAVGVAGLTRSLAPDAMEAVLRPAFAALKALGPRHVHYKVCSTFDSSPTVGSIGRAIDVGVSVFGGHVVPLLVAAPALGRYCVFGNLYARYGIGSNGAIHRLDRHPSASKHPVTPMTEADLRVHLGKQTSKKIGLVSVTDLEPLGAGADPWLVKPEWAGADIVLFDGINDAHLLRAGALIDGLALAAPFFSVGSSGIEAALTAHWACRARSDWLALQPSAPLLVVSGSCSPVTSGQIAWAEANGFALIALDPAAPDVATTTAAAIRELKAGRHTLVYTSRGEAGAQVSAKVLGTALGQIARTAVEQTGLRRLLVAGGDTSSYAGRALGIEAVEMIAPFAPGAPLCRAFAPGSPADGLEVNFKGGQVGAPDYFGAVARGQL